MPSGVDAVELARALIRCPSVTPADAGALDILQRALEPLGFACHRLRFETEGTAPIDNLYARLGSSGRNFCFAGHTDVVPVGDRKAWSVDPFAADIVAGRLFGRGASDMKAAIAAFVAAVARRIAGPGLDGSVSLLITGDEEGPSINGTRRMLDWLTERGEKLDACVVGEPTSARQLGDTVKIGRRGSMTCTVTALGAQGHTAYPHLADNPLPRLVRVLARLTDEPLDQGSAHFQPSTLQISTIDVGNPATNVIPARGTAQFNIRFNDCHSSASLEAHVRRVLAEIGGEYDLAVQVSGESFLTQPGPLSRAVCAAVEAETGRTPELSTTGGTSDARFIKDHCPVVELGMVGQTMHKVDENVPVADIDGLTRIYQRLLGDWTRA
jgi:succinyl-diaminopimelate desuccinylase